MSSPRADRFLRALPWIMAAALPCIVLACYWPALNGALLWDDPAHITSPELRDWPGLLRIWTVVGATQEYYPVLHGAFWLEHKLWGDSTLGYHLVNVFLHSGSCLLLAVLLARLWTRRDERPEDAGVVGERIVPAGAEWLAALLFALHPVCVESVAWITEQKNTLSLFLCLISAIVYLGFEQTRTKRRYFTALLFYFLTLAAKPSTIALPAALLVLVWWRNGRLGIRRDVLPMMPFFGVALVAGLVTMWVETHHVGASGTDFDWSLLDRTLLAGRVIWFYLGKLVWPAELIFYYEHWDLAAVAGRWWPCLVGSVALTVVLWAIRHRSRGPLVAWLLFVGTLFPVLGFINVYGMTFSQVADHFQYLPTMVFLAAAAGGIAIALGHATRWLRTAGAAALLVVLVIFGVRSHQQSALYVDDETLFGSVVARNPDSWMAHQILGLAIQQSKGRGEEAIGHFRKAIEIDPEYPDAHLALGVELVKRPETREQGIAEYLHALELRPVYAEAHNALGVELAKQPGRVDEAIAHFREALKLRPRLAIAHLNLANALARDPAHLPEAIAHFEEVIRIRPDYARGFNDYGLVLSHVPGRTGEAVKVLETAIKLAPDFAEAHCNLADTLAGLPNRTSDALVEYETSLKLDPSAAKAHYGLANLLATREGRVDDAISHYESAIRFAPGFAPAHANLANVLAQIPGREHEAVAQYLEALKIEPKLAWVHFNLAMLLARDPATASTAESHYREALRLKPDYTDAMNGIAILFAQQGRLDEARAQWQHALEIDPNYSTARQNLRLLEEMRSRQR